jgi:hypothetical protein
MPEWDDDPAGDVPWSRRPSRRSHPFPRFVLEAAFNSHGGGLVRSVDLLAAGAIALFSVAVVFSLNPIPAQDSARTLLQDSKLRIIATAAVERVGLPSLERGSASELCSTLAAMSNSTVSFGLRIDGVWCEGKGSNSGEQIVIRFPQRIVAVEASWTAGAA